MTGRDLILYILENDLEDELVFDDSKFIGFMTAEEAAVKFGVGIATINSWVREDIIDGIFVRQAVYISANATPTFNNHSELKGD